MGPDDERDLFPEAIRLTAEARPRAVMLENVPGLGHPDFAEYRKWIAHSFESMGYVLRWEKIWASDHGVPQARPRLVLVGIFSPWAAGFTWPEPIGKPPTVGDTLYPLMASEGWPGAEAWRAGAQRIGWTLSGAAKTGGGPDLGGSRAKKAWTGIGVNARGIADTVPGPDGNQQRGKSKITCADEVGPMLTIEMAALLQGFPSSWRFEGGKTSQYRQISHAFPPPVARALGEKIALQLDRRVILG